jgi:hypothetical protein
MSSHDGFSVRFNCLRKRRTIAMLDASGVCEREPAGEDRNAPL